jgi:hypothetical protein
LARLVSGMLTYDLLSTLVYSNTLYLPD